MCYRPSFLEFVPFHILYKIKSCGTRYCFVEGYVQKKKAECQVIVQVKQSGPIRLVPPSF